MKKLTSFLITLVSVLLLTIVIVGTKNVNADEDVKPTAVVGTNSADSDFYSQWQPTHYGSTRIDDTTTKIAAVTAWGARGVFKTKYDLTSFTATIDLKDIPGNTIVMLAFANNGQDANPYPAADNSGITMDILKKDTNEHKYLVTFANPGHNISVDGFTGGDDAFRNDYTGIFVSPDNDKVTISFADDGENIKVTVNTVTVTLAKSVAFKNISKPTEATVILGAFNGSGSAETINYEISLSDAATREYYSETGTYGKAKAALAAYTESLNADLTVFENVQNAVTKRDAVVLTGIRDYDLPRLQPTKAANDEVLAAALLKFAFPETTTSQVTYRKDKENSVEINVDLKEQAISEIKVNEKAIESGNYSVNEGVLTITSKGFEDLDAGTYDITITTAGGSCTTKVVVYEGTEFIPTITETSVTHQLDTPSNVEVSLDTKDIEISSVKLGDEEVSDYTYSNGTFTLKNAYLETLDAGTYTVKVSTIEGEVSFELTITEPADIKDRVPVLGEYGNDTNIYSEYQSGSFGVVRTGLTEMKIITTSSFGFRAGYRNTFDVTNLEGSLNLKDVTNGAIIMVLLGSNNQTYFSEGAGHVYLEIVKMTDNQFFIAFGNPTLSGDKHAASYPDFNDGTQSDKPGFSGITVTSETSEVTFKMVLNADKSVTITVNNATYTIADAFSVLSDPKNTYISFCGMTDTTTNQKYTINYMYDAKLKEYYSENGTFGSAVKNVASLLEAVKTLETSEQVYAAITLKDEIDINALYSHDYNFIKRDYEKAVSILDKAIDANPEILLEVAEKAVEKAQEAANAMASISDDANVMSLIEAAKTRIDSLKETESIDKDEIEKLEQSLNEVKAIRTTFIKTTVAQQFTDYIDSIDKITDVETMKTSIVLRDTIALNYEELFESDEWTSLTTSKAEADVKLGNIINYTGTAWEIKKGSSNIFEKDGLFHVLSSNSVNVYTREKLDASNFDIELTNVTISSNTGSWFSIGIMEQKDLFINVEDEGVQENKGILFLITYADKTHVSIQMYTITLMSGGFLTSNVQETITVDITDGLSMHLGTKEVTVAGVTANYMDVRFNNVEFTSLLSPKTFDISLGNERKGYLNISTSGTSGSSMTTYTIKSINGHKLTDETYEKEYVPTPPTSTDTSKEFTMKTTSSVSYALNTYGLDITSVTVNGKALEAKNYTYANNYLALKNDYLTTLEKGTYKIEVSTADGKVELTLVVNAAPASSTSNKKGCGCSSAVLVSAMAALVTTCAGAMLLLKKREN